jgi:hypothetical protein
MDQALLNEYEAGLVVANDFDIVENDDVSVGNDVKENLANEFSGTSL